MQQTHIRPRKLRFEFEQVPRHWFRDNAVATHIANGVNLLFPAGERFFVRSVRRYLDRIRDPVLLERVKGFAGQEGRHAQAHEEYFVALEAQGYDLKRFMDLYERVAYGGIERLTGYELRLAVTVALEHFTAIMAENALTDGLLEDAHPEMRRLLMWHAAEEIEHKSVAFDVLREVNPSYALRMAGLAIGCACLTGFWIAGTLALLRQDGLRWRQIANEAKRLGRDHPIGRRVFARGIREYVRRDFHPSDNDNYPLAASYLASAGIA